MTKYDGRTNAPILVENLGAISGGESAHLYRPFFVRFFRSLSFLLESQGKDGTGTAIPALRTAYHFLKMGLIRAACGTPGGAPAD